MLFSRIVRTGPEKVFAICKNTEASATMSDGECVVFSVSTTANWGSDILKATAAAQATAAGIVSGNDILTGNFGTIQVYGFHPNVKTTAAALTAGTIVTSDAAAAVLAASVAALANITDQRIGVCLKLGAANRAGVFIAHMGMA